MGRGLVLSQDLSYNKYMNKIFNKKVIILVVVLLVLGGAYYFSSKNKKNPEPGQKQEQTGGEDKTGAPDNSPVKEGESGGQVNPGNNSSSSVTPDLTDTFNKAINKAQVAFGKKDYDGAISAYNEALNYIKSDKVYAGLYTAYTAKQDWPSALKALDSALSLNSANPDYWKWKMTLLDEKTDAKFADLKLIYEDGLTKVDPRTKINLVTHLASIAVSNQEKTEAIALWEKAKELYPENAAVYQKEIDKLK